MDGVDGGTFCCLVAKSEIADNGFGRWPLRIYINDNNTFQRVDNGTNHVMDKKHKLAERMLFPCFLLQKPEHFKL